MKILLILFLFAASVSRAGEAGLTQTIQPLDNQGDILLVPVMCYDWGFLSGLPTAIGLITAKNIPPTNAPKHVEDINLASACGLELSYAEDAAGRGIITLDCRSLKVPERFGCTQLQVVGATLECLRQVAGAKLDAMIVKTMLRSDGQEAVQKLVDAFVKQPKDKPFKWE